MKYLTQKCRQKEFFKECCLQQINTYFNYINDEFHINEDFSITKIELFKKYQNSKILIVGGGPTTNWYNWDPTDYDFIFSCNHFYLNDRLKNIDVSFSMISGEVDTSSVDFKDYFNKGSTIFCYENVDIEDFKIKKMLEIGRTVIAILRHNLKTGTAARLLYLTSQFNPSEIHVVGMDGLPNNGRYGDDTQHSFEVGKRLNTIHFNYAKYLEEYTMLWGYLKEKFPSIKFKNLGHGHPYNISTRLNII